MLKIIYILLSTLSLSQVLGWTEGLPDLMSYLLLILFAPTFGFFVLIGSLTDILYLPFLTDFLMYGILFGTLMTLILQGISLIVTKIFRLTKLNEKQWWLVWGIAVMANGFVYQFALINQQQVFTWGPEFLIIASIASAAIIFYFFVGLKKLIKLFFKKTRPKMTLEEKKNWQITWRVFLIIFWIWMGMSILSVGGWLAINTTPAMSSYAVLNAAVKNTCLLDPEKKNCPRTLEEISYIEPEEYKKKIVERNVQAKYVHDQESGLYTWMVRTTPDRVVIFDWRLVNETGLDFKEAKVGIWSNKVEEVEEMRAWRVEEEFWQFPEWDWSRGWNANNWW